MMEDTESIRVIVCQRIEQVENAMKSLEVLRKTLMHKAYEAKQSILNAYISRRDSMHCEEMNLLTEVDRLLHSKDDALVTQLSKLSQVLGCLRNCLQSPHPCGECLEKFEDIDMLSVNEVSLEFSAANEALKKSINHPQQSSRDYGCRSATGDEMDSMTKWLLTPSNNHSMSLTMPQDFISTEWLLQHHVYACTEGGTTEVFASVKEDEVDLWLNKESFPAVVRTSTFQRTSQDSQGWLLKNARQISVSDDETMASDITSSIASSCVVISGSTSEDGSTCTYSDGTWTNRPISRCESPYTVSQWVATCKVGDVDDSRVDVESVAYSVAEPMEGSHGEWLSHDAVLNTGDDDIGLWLLGANCPNLDSSVDVGWLKPVAADSMCAQLSSSKMDDTSASWGEEKLDLPSNEWLSKTSDGYEISTGNWLQSGFKDCSSMPSKSSLDVNDWLGGEEKRDEPENMSITSKPDREWLLVKNELSRIAATCNSDWVIRNQSTSLRDNRLHCSDS